MTSLLETSAWLIDIPSVTGSEALLRDAIAGHLLHLPQKKVGDSLVVGSPNPRAVLLAGHLDTVPEQGNSVARIDGDRLYGLGATDMKGGLAVMIHLLDELGPEKATGIFYAGEEGPLEGNQMMTVLDDQPWLREARAAIVLEPTDRQVHAGCQGGINASVGFVGISAHSARPWLGENAVTKSAGFLEMMSRLEPEEHIIEGLVFKEVISVTRAEGGIANNVIPARFDLNVNYRFAPDRTPEEAVERLRNICSGADEFELTDVAPAGRVDAAHPLFQELIAETRAEVAGKQGWTDVAQLSAVGIPAVNFGPGETSLAHKPGESVRVSDLEWVYRSLLSVLR